MTKRLATANDSGLAFWYWNRPVSVAMAQKRFCAMSAEMGTPRYRANSQTMTPAAAASGRMRWASATGSSVGWWSMITDLRARFSTASASPSLEGMLRSTLMKRSGASA